MARKKKQKLTAQSEVGQKLEIVLKCDVAGTAEAINGSLAEIDVPAVQIDVIQTGVGNVSKSDVLMALTGSRLVVGFGVDTAPKLEQEVKALGVEVRLYDTIYKLTEDIRKIAQSFESSEPQEKVTGRAKVIATFNISSKGMVIGCDVLEGVIETGKDFRVITAMGPAYFGRIKSLQIERQTVRSAKPGNQIGIQLDGWNKAKVDDLVECFETLAPKSGGRWKAGSGIVRSIST